MSPDSSDILSGCWNVLAGPGVVVRLKNCTVVRKMEGTACEVFGGGPCVGVPFSGVNWLGWSEEGSVAVGKVAGGRELSRDDMG